MRRHWIVVAAVVACAGLAGQTSSAYAERGSTHAASSCSDLVKKYQGFSAAESHAFANSSNPNSIQKVYASIAKALNKLASSGPSELKTAFQHLAQYVPKLSHVDFSKPSSVQALSSSVRQVRPDLAKIQNYFGSVCHYTPPAT